MTLYKFPVPNQRTMIFFQEVFWEIMYLINDLPIRSAPRRVNMFRLFFTTEHNHHINESMGNNIPLMQLLLILWTWPHLKHIISLFPAFGVTVPNIFRLNSRQLNLECWDLIIMEMRGVGKWNPRPNGLGYVFTKKNPYQTIYGGGLAWEPTLKTLLIFYISVTKLTSNPIVRNSGININIVHVAPVTLLRLAFPPPGVPIVPSVTDPINAPNIMAVMINPMSFDIESTPFNVFICYALQMSLM